MEQPFPSVVAANLPDHIKNYGILGALAVVMATSGVLVHQLADKNPLVVPHADWCQRSVHYPNNNATAELAESTKALTLTTTTTMPPGLAATTAVFCVLWPLLHMVLNSRKSLNEAKLESIVSHLLGQSSNYGIAEIFRTQMVYPEHLFLDKCNLSPEECLELSQRNMPLPLYQTPAGAEEKALCRNTTLSATNPLLYNSLHHYPDPVCMLFGSALVSFIASILHWRSLNPTQKKMYDTSANVRSVLMLSDLATITCVLFYLYHLYMAYDLQQLLGVLVGIVLQVMINRTVVYGRRSPPSRRELAAAEDAPKEMPLV